jgi:hypothetical protein
MHAFETKILIIFREDLESEVLLQVDMYILRYATLVAA